MTVHLVKMAVGIDSVDHLIDVQADRLRQAEHGGVGVLRHLTRNTPRRAEEVLDGGSIYWVIKGYIRAHQPITSFGEAMGQNGRPRCALILDPKLVRTELVPHRSMQGWRYMEAPTAPKNLSRRTAAKTSMPDEMEAELRALGLL
jgi:hypothetical protein